jgi:putative ABC transport system ATP-binding protein
MPAPLVEVRDLWKVYELGDVRVEALRGVTLSIDAGEAVAVMGSSGSGKSTFMNLLGCLDRPTRGSLRFGDHEILATSADARAEIRSREIGFVFQSFNLIPRTSAIENVELPLVYAGVSAAEQATRAREALRSVGLAGREQHTPSQLSGGQQQRVAIARALVNRPRLLLADEPTGNLDSRSSREIMEIFQRLQRDSGITLIVVTHEPEIASFLDRVITFRDGEVISDVRQTGVRVGALG